MLIFTSCKDDLGTAPKDVSGKTMHIAGYTIKFSSNTSGQVQFLTSPEEYGTWSYSRIAYEKTSPTSATLRISGSESSDYYGYWGQEMEFQFTLLFASPNEGTYNAGSGTFTLF